MEKQMTLQDFFNKADFVLCNKVSDILSQEELTDGCLDFYCGDGTHPYNYWITSLSESDCEYYHKTYGLSFIYSSTLDVYIFINDLCCGMSYSDYVLKENN